MNTELHPEHPDHDLPVGATCESNGRVWKLGANQYVTFWRSGPKDGTVVCSKDYPHGSSGPYIAGGVVCTDFDKAAARAQKVAKAEYERALVIVKRYEAEDD